MTYHYISRLLVTENDARANNNFSLISEETTASDDRVDCRDYERKRFG